VLLLASHMAAVTAAPILRVVRRVCILCVGTSCRAVVLTTLCTMHSTFESSITKHILQVIWTPLSGPDDTAGTGDIADVDDPDTDLIGKPWTYRLVIKGATILPIAVSSCFVQVRY
jgi:hypothetical protein